MKRYLVSAALLLAVACSLPSDVCGCSPPEPATGLASGLVTGPDGTPVAGAWIRGEVRGRGCVLSDANPPSRSMVQTNVSGQYLLYMHLSYATDSACVRLVARRSDSPGVDSTVVDGLRMRFKLGAGSWPRDSIRVDFQLR